MAVDARRPAVSGPSGVSNASVRIEDLLDVDAALVDHLLEFRDLADLFEGKHLILLVTVDGEAGGVVATVL
jgi:hypothetical protein